MEDCDIVDIHFAFNNKIMTDKLVERSVALKAAQFDKLQEVQKDLTQIKNEKFDEINTPNYMWITFRKDAGIYASLDLKKF